MPNSRSLRRPSAVMSSVDQAGESTVRTVTSRSPCRRSTCCISADIASIAGPVTKMAVTVLEAAQVPGVFQQAFHLMRSGRPGPVLIDLPLDVQLTEIQFDPDTYEPLPIYKPAATRA